MPERPLQHREPDKKDDETLQKEARAHLAGEPALQLVAELIARLREVDVPWWSPLRLRDRWGAVERMRWFRERGDLRQRITSALSGLAQKAARRKTPDFQGALIDSVLDEGDITPRAFEEAFRPHDLAVYGPAGAYWHFFRESMPWDHDTPVHQELMAWLLKSLLADRSPFDGIGRTPILTPWDVRTAIDGRVWHTRMPVEIRVAVDDARLQQERDRPGVPFHADGDLAIAMPEIIAASIPLRDLIPILVVAQKSMRFEPPRTGPKIENGKPGVGPEPGARPHEVGSPSTPPPPLASASLPGGPPQSTPPPPHPSFEGGPHAGPHAKPATVAPPPLVATVPVGPPSVAPAPVAPAPLAPVPLAPTAAPVPPPLVTPPGSLAGLPPAGHLPPSVASPAPGSAGPASSSAPAPGSGPIPTKAGLDAIAPPPLVDPTRMAPLAPPAPEISVAGRETAEARPGSKGSSGRGGGGGGGGGGGPSPSASGTSAILAVLNSIDPEDDLEMTNPYSTLSPEEIAAELERLPPEGSLDGGRRRRAKA